MFRNKNPYLTFSLTLGLLYFTSYLTRLNYSTVMADIILSDTLTPKEAGLIGTALFFCYGAGQVVSGLAADRLPPQHLISAGIMTTVCCNLLMPLVGAPWAMTVIWAINGFAQAMFWPPILKLMIRFLDDEKYHRGNLIVGVACHGATILIYIIVPICLALASWRLPFFFSASFGAAVLLVWFFAYPYFERSLPVADKNSSAPIKNEAKSAKPAGLKTRSCFCFFLYICACNQRFSGFPARRSSILRPPSLRRSLT